MPPSANMWMDIMGFAPHNKKEDYEPFTLGFKGERWEHDICALIIPVEGPTIVLLVRRWKHDDGLSYRIYHAHDTINTDDTLMTAALVRKFIDDYLSEKAKGHQLADAGDTGSSEGS